jgi:hypothetical protein
MQNPRSAVKSIRIAKHLARHRNGTCEKRGGAQMGAEVAFVLVQGFMVLFLLLHDWVPLGPFNDIEGVKGQIPFKRNVLNTAVNTIPIAVALGLSLWYFRDPYPTAVRVYLISIYALFLLGEFRAWWKPYLFGAEPALVQRYDAIFGRTHAFLPKRNGIVPNTAHVVLHACTLLAFVLAILVGR